MQAKGGPCSFEGCGRPALTKELCSGHYQQLWKGQKLRPVRTRKIGQRPRPAKPPEQDPLCSFEGCDRPHSARELCQGHYTQWHKGHELTPLTGSPRLATVGKACDFPDCGRQVDYRGLCQTHYKQQLRGEELRPIMDRNTPKVCSFSGCDRQMNAKGYCRGHYQQLRNGKPLTPLGSTRAVKEGPCLAEGCIRHSETSIGLCRAHQKQHNDGKDLTPLVVDTRRPLSVREQGIARRYGMSPEAYQDLLALQGGVCLGCGQEPGNGRPPLVVDHDHSCCPNDQKTCGQCVRGLLCHACNVTLGHAYDNPDVLERLAAYLRGANAMNRQVAASDA